MREIGRIDNELDANVFRDFLYNRGIGCELESNKAGGWTVWVDDEDRMDEAASQLQQFLIDPSNTDFIKGADGADELRKEKQRQEKEYARKVRTGGDLFQTYGFSGIGRITLALIVLSIIATLLCQFGKNDALFQRLAIAETFDVPGQGRMYYKHLVELQAGQLWRLITPIFVHFSIIHILFNMMWLRDLGSMLERIRGVRFYIVFILIVSAASNIGQFFMSGPGFGGMSGVVYALLGYVWMQSRFNPWSGFLLHATTVQMMLIWFFLCLSGLVGNIANTAHAVGLVSGIVWGYIDARRRVPE